MRKKILLKVYRYYGYWEEKFKGKLPLIDYLLIVIISVLITFKFKQGIEERFFPQKPAGYIIYDYVKPEVPLPIRERIPFFPRK